MVFFVVVNLLDFSLKVVSQSLEDVWSNLEVVGLQDRDWVLRSTSRTNALAKGKLFLRSLIEHGGITTFILISRIEGLVELVSGNDWHFVDLGHVPHMLEDFELGFLVSSNHTNARGRWHQDHASVLE